MCEISTFRTKSSGLARLLGFALDKDLPQRGEWPREALKKLLQATVTGTFPAEAVAQVSSEAPEQMDGLRKKTLENALLNSETDLVVLKAIRDYGKKHAAGRTNDPRHSVAVVVYYAAIASALLFHGRKVTRYPYKKLVSAFQKLADKPWMIPKFAKHFSEAQELCQAKNL